MGPPGYAEHVADQKLRSVLVEGLGACESGAVQPLLDEAHSSLLEIDHSQLFQNPLIMLLRQAARFEFEVLRLSDSHHTAKRTLGRRRRACIRGADMSHQRQMESSRKRTPEEWRGYKRLGMAVIASAVQDLKKPTRAGKESGWARESARAFLTVSNPNLKFWCSVADFDMNTILRKYWPDTEPS